MALRQNALDFSLLQIREAAMQQGVDVHQQPRKSDRGRRVELIAGNVTGGRRVRDAHVPEWTKG